MLQKVKDTKLEYLSCYMLKNRIKSKIILKLFLLKKEKKVVIEKGKKGDISTASETVHSITWN